MLFFVTGCEFFSSNWASEDLCLGFRTENLSFSRAEVGLTFNCASEGFGWNLGGEVLLGCTLDIILESFPLIRSWEQRRAFSLDVVTFILIVLSSLVFFLGLPLTSGILQPWPKGDLFLCYYFYHLILNYFPQTVHLTGFSPVLSRIGVSNIALLSLPKIFDYGILNRTFGSDSFLTKEPSRFALG